jgi:hypothetical protein
MRFRKGVVPLILFAIVAAAVIIAVFSGRDRVPMEKPGESVFGEQP